MMCNGRESKDAVVDVATADDLLGIKSPIIVADLRSSGQLGSLRSATPPAVSRRSFPPFPWCSGEWGQAPITRDWPRLG